MIFHSRYFFRGTSVSPPSPALLYNQYLINAETVQLLESYYNLRQLGITNCVDRQLLQNAATLITKCVVRFYYKTRIPYHKTRWLLRNAADSNTLRDKESELYKGKQTNRQTNKQTNRERERERFVSHNVDTTELCVTCYKYWTNLEYLFFSRGN